MIDDQCQQVNLQQDNESVLDRVDTIDVFAAPPTSTKSWKQRVRWALII